LIFFDSILVLVLVLVFVIGICVGSFVNVCIYRLPRNKQAIAGRSFCPKCKKTIRWFDNLPLISFLLLNGKCRKCHKSISLEYFFVELIAGIGFLLIYLSSYNYHAIIFLSVLFILYLIIFFIDLKHSIIPDSLNFSIMVLAIFKNFLPNFNTSFIHDINQSIIGGIVGYLSIWIIIYLYRIIKKIEGMGLGDAKLMTGIGLLFGWQSIPFVLFVSAVLGLILVIPSLISKKKNLRSEIPFGPFIITACFIYFMCGDFLYSLILF
jgi:leader peptidase (prepilin peptidase)/N-methyltransferase